MIEGACLGSTLHLARVWHCRSAGWEREPWTLHVLVIFITHGLVSQARSRWNKASQTSPGLVSVFLGSLWAPASGGLVHFLSPVVLTVFWVLYPVSVKSEPESRARYVCLLVRNYSHTLGFLGGSAVKSPLAVQETQVQSLGLEDPLEKEMVTQLSIHVWRTPWTEEPCKLQSVRLQRVRYHCRAWARIHYTTYKYVHCRITPEN